MSSPDRDRELDAADQKIRRNIDDIASGRPTRRAMRGTECAEHTLDLYSADPKSWPRPDGDVVPQICWAGLPIPVHRADRHFLIAGLPGTGKTIAIRLLMQSVFEPNCARNLGGAERAVIYDPKQEFYPILRGMGVKSERITILNPFDKRGIHWNLAEDYTNTAEAYQLAQTIIPTPESHSQPFFPKAAAAMLAAVISVHMNRAARDAGLSGTKPDDLRETWDLADIILTCLNPAVLFKTLEAEPRNPYAILAQNLCGDSTTRNNIIAELSSHLFEFAPIAACWRAARGPKRQGFSISQFLESEDRIVLLGANQTHSAAIGAINRLLLKRLAEKTLDKPASGKRNANQRTWLILDETRELGKVAGLTDLINKGRSRGVCAVLGFQDYAGMKHAFGELPAHELTASCAHKVFLKLGGESAEWASRAIGKAEIMETQPSWSSGSNMSSNTADTTGSGKSDSKTSHGWEWSKTKGGFTNEGSTRAAAFGSTRTMTTTSTVRETDALLASQIAHLPDYEEGDGLNGFVCRSSSKDTLAQVYKLMVPAHVLDLADLSDHPDDVGFIPRPQEQQDLVEIVTQMGP